MNTDSPATPTGADSPQVEKMEQALQRAADKGFEAAFEAFCNECGEPSSHERAVAALTPFLRSLVAEVMKEAGVPETLRQADRDLYRLAGGVEMAISASAANANRAGNEASAHTARTLVALNQFLAGKGGAQ